MRSSARSGVPKFEILNVSWPDFFKDVNSQITVGSVQDWQTYLRWHVAHSRAPFLSSAFVNENFEFYRKYLRGATELQPRWKRCVQYTDGDLGEALGQVYVRKTFGPELKASTVLMTQQIEDAMAVRIQQLDWMSPATKQQALVKLKAIRNKVGYPDKWRDYSTVKIVRGRLLRQRHSRDGVRDEAAAGEGRSAGGPYRVGHDSADGQCVLQPADERHQFSGGSVAASAV